MGQIRGILFDKDGTLFDFGATWGPWTARFVRRLTGGDEAAARALARDMHYDIDAERHLPTSPFIAGTLEDWVDIITPHAGGLDRDALMRRIAAESAGAAQVPAADLPPLMSDLKTRGLRLGVATNDGKEGVARHLAEARIAHLMDFVAGYDSGFGAKPAPGMLTAFAAAVDLPPAAVLMVGDSRHDLDAAQAAGMRRVAVLTGGADHAALQDHAEAVLPSIAHLPAWLARARLRRRAAPPQRRACGPWTSTEPPRTRGARACRPPRRHAGAGGDRHRPFARRGARRAGGQGPPCGSPQPRHAHAPRPGDGAQHYRAGTPASDPAPFDRAITAPGRYLAFGAVAWPPNVTGLDRGARPGDCTAIGKRNTPTQAFACPHMAGGCPVGPGAPAPATRIACSPRRP